MKTVFAVDATALNQREASKLLEKVDTSIASIIEDMGFKFRLRANSDGLPIISFVVEDK